MRLQRCKSDKQATVDKGTYYKVSVDHTVVNFAPEAGSSTTKDDSGLGKLKKLRFVVP